MMATVVLVAFLTLSGRLCRRGPAPIVVGHVVPTEAVPAGTAGPTEAPEVDNHPSRVLSA